jgi:hypothetical protein
MLSNVITNVDTLRVVFGIYGRVVGIFLLLLLLGFYTAEAAGINPF